MSRLTNKTPGYSGLVLLLASLLALLAGCVSSADTGNTPEGRQQKVAPSISLKRPQPGERLAGKSLSVEVETQGLTMAPEAVSKAKEEGRGHWHLYIDGNFVDFSTAPVLVVGEIPTGPHHLRVSLANNDHSPLDPPAEDSVVIDVVDGPATTPLADEAY